MDYINMNEEEKSREQLLLSDKSIRYLFEIQKWARFLSIIGFIMLGFVVIFGIIVIFSLAFTFVGISSFSSLVGFLYIAIALLYFFPVLYLFRFSDFIKKAILENNSENLTLAFLNLKSFFKFLGIFTIVILSIYAIIFLVTIVVGSLGFM